MERPKQKQHKKHLLNGVEILIRLVKTEVSACGGRRSGIRPSACFQVSLPRDPTQWPGTGSVSRVVTFAETPTGNPLRLVPTGALLTAV